MSADSRSRPCAVPPSRSRETVHHGAAGARSSSGSGAADEQRGADRAAEVAEPGDVHGRRALETNRCGSIALSIRFAYGSPSRVPRPPPTTTASTSSRFRADARPAPSASTARSTSRTASGSSSARALAQTPLVSRVSVGLLHDLEQVRLLAPRRPPCVRVRLHRRPACIGFDAAATAAQALRAVSLDDHVADLARGAAAEPRLAVEDDATADAGAPEDAEDRRVRFAGAELELGFGGDLDVVSDRDLRAERVAERLPERERRVPAGEVRRAGRPCPLPGRRHRASRRRLPRAPPSRSRLRRQPRAARRPSPRRRFGGPPSCGVGRRAWPSDLVSVVDDDRLDLRSAEVDAASEAHLTAMVRCSTSPSRAIKTSATSDGGKSPWPTTPGVRSSRAASSAGSPTGPR